MGFVFFKICDASDPTWKQNNIAEKTGKTRERRRIIGLILSSSNLANKDAILKTSSNTIEPFVETSFVDESFPSLFETRDPPVTGPVFQITQHCCGPAVAGMAKSMRECVGVQKEGRGGADGG